MTTKHLQAPLNDNERYLTACPVGCNAPLIATAIVPAEGPLLGCVECGQLVSQANARRYAETMRAFDAPDFDQPSIRERARRTRVAQRRLRRVSHLLGKTPAAIRLLDVGCSRGHFVAAAVQAGFRAEGVEPAPRTAKAARAAGLRVYQGLLEQARFGEDAFDAVTLFEVIEHLKDPLALLRECHRILKPDGMLCLSTGNAHSWTVSYMGARWDYFSMDKDGGHVSFYNPRSLALLAKRAGFAPVRIDTARVRFTEKGEVPRAIHALGKIAAELLNAPARLAGRGHDMTAYLKRK